MPGTVGEVCPRFYIRTRDNVPSFKVTDLSRVFKHISGIYIVDHMAILVEDDNLITGDDFYNSLVKIRHFQNLHPIGVVKNLDSHYKNQESTSEERERSLNNMIKIALEGQV